MSEEEKNTRVCFVARPVLPLGVQVCLPVSFVELISMMNLLLLA